MAPIPLRIQIAEIKLLLPLEFDGRRCARNLARHKSFATQGTFVVEQDTVGRVHPIGFAIIDCDPIGIKLGRSIWASRIEWGAFCLRSLLNLSIQFRRRRLIESGLLVQPKDSY